MMLACLLDDLEQFTFNPAGQPLCVYGDPAYLLRIHLQQPFKYGVLTPQMEEYNHRMSAVRTSVEWLSGDVVNSFKFNYFKRNLKIFLNSVGKIYVVSVILQNALTCLYGNLTSTFLSSHHQDLKIILLRKWYEQVTKNGSFNYV